MCPKYFHNLCHNLYNSFGSCGKCTLWDTICNRSHSDPLKEDEDEDPENLKFWVPQRSFSTQSVQSLTPSLKSLKRDSVTSASTIAEEEDPFTLISKRRHSDISRTLIGRSHEWPERISKNRLLERTNSTSSIKISAFRESLKSQSESQVITEEEAVNSITKSEMTTTEEEELTFGSLLFSTNYDPKRKRLNVHLDKAIDLPQRGRKKTYDSLIRISLISKQYDKNSKNSFNSKDVISVQSSRKVKNTLSPHFHEDFIFDVEKFESLKNLFLRLSLFDFERQGRFEAIGHIVLALNCLTKEGNSNKHDLYFKCQPSLDFKPNGPQILISLSYSSATDKLTVGILRCRRLILRKSSFFENLLKGINSSKLETYVKVKLMCASHKIKSIKTNTVMADTDCDPVFNQTFTFFDFLIKQLYNFSDTFRLLSEAPHGFIDDIYLVMSVCVKGKLKFDSVIGRVISGPIAFTSNNKLTHWGKMIFEQPRVVSEWRNLYS